MADARKTKADYEKIAASNPRVDTASVERVRETLSRLRAKGVLTGSKPKTRPASPFVRRPLP